MRNIEHAWEAALRAAHVTTADKEPFPVARGAHWDGARWHVFLPEHTQVAFDHDANDHFDLLADAWSEDEDGVVLRDRIGEGQILQEVVHHAGRAAADAELYGTAAPNWPTVFADISRALSIAIAAVPIGGVFSNEVDAQGNAKPLRIGARAVVGHLDNSLEEAVQALARSVGVPGFRFTDESWWTEDFMAAQEDDEVERDGSWPWMVAAWALPVAGVAAEHAAVIASEALMGTLVLLDHSPGQHWGRFVPWIPGCPSGAGNPYVPDVIDSDNTIDTEVQQVDGRLERRDSATNSGTFTAPHEIDLGMHAAGPASALLAATADAASTGPASDADHAWKLASGGRLAFAAAAATASDVRVTLASRAIELLSSVVGAVGPGYTRLSQAGYRWRVEHDAQWPPCRLITTPQPLDAERWQQRLPTYEQLGAGQEDVGYLPPWALKRVEDAEFAMDALQATLFGLAAQVDNDREQL